MRALRLLMVFGLFFIMLSSFSMALDIVNNTVYINDSRVYMSVYPSELHGSGYVYIDLMLKNYSGDINALFGFDHSDFYPVSFEYFNPHNVTLNYSYYCDGVLNYSESDFFCYSANGSLLYQHPYDSISLANSTAYWDAVQESEWSVVPADYELMNYSFDNKNLWWWLKGLNVSPNMTYKTRVWLNAHLSLGIGDLPPVIKYDLGFYPSSYNDSFSHAFLNDDLYFIDPLILTNSLVAYYTFDSDDSYTFYDSADWFNGSNIEHHNLVARNITNEIPIHYEDSFVDGVIGKAFCFNCFNDGDSVESGHTFGVAENLEDWDEFEGSGASGSGLTFCTWFKTTDKSSNSALFSKDWDGVQRNYILYSHYAGRTDTLTVLSGLSGGWKTELDYVNASIFDGSWHHLCMTNQDGIHGSSDFYIDGQIQEYINNYFFSESIVNNAPFMIGGQYNNLGLGRFWSAMNVTIDEFRLYDGVLNSSQVLQLYEYKYSVSLNITSPENNEEILSPYLIQWNVSNPDNLELFGNLSLYKHGSIAYLLDDSLNESVISYILNQSIEPGYYNLTLELCEVNRPYICYNDTRNIYVSWSSDLDVPDWVDYTHITAYQSTFAPNNGFRLFNDSGHIVYRGDTKLSFYNNEYYISERNGSRFLDKKFYGSMRYNEIYSQTQTSEFGACVYSNLTDSLPYFIPNGSHSLDFSAWCLVYVPYTKLLYIRRLGSMTIDNSPVDRRCENVSISPNSWINFTIITNYTDIQVQMWTHAFYNDSESGLNTCDMYAYNNITIWPYGLARTSNGTVSVYVRQASADFDGFLINGTTSFIIENKIINESEASGYGNLSCFYNSEPYYGLGGFDALCYWAGVSSFSCYAKIEEDDKIIQVAPERRVLKNGVVYNRFETDSNNVVLKFSRKNLKDGVPVRMSVYCSNGSISSYYSDVVTPTLVTPFYAEDVLFYSKNNVYYVGVFIAFLFLLLLALSFFKWVIGR